MHFFSAKNGCVGECFFECVGNTEIGLEVMNSRSDENARFRHLMMFKKPMGKLSLTNPNQTILPDLLSRYETLIAI